MLSIVPGAAPFCRMDDVAEAVAKPVSVKLPFGSTMFHDNELAAAPSVQVGVVMVTSAGAPPLTDVSWPVGPNASVPVATENGVPAVPPVTSAPGTVTPYDHAPAAACFVNVIVAMCGAPSESYTWTAELNVEPVAVFAFRLVSLVNDVVADGARRTPGETRMFVKAPDVRIAPVTGSVWVYPCTNWLSGVTRLPSLSKVKAPARV